MSNRNRNAIKPHKPKRKEVLITSEQHFQGPVPPPSLLAGYDEIVPGAADRIISMTEKQLEHRLNIENKVIESKIKDSKLGMILGFFVATFVIAVGGMAIYMGKDLLGASAIITVIAGLVGTFVYATNSNKKEREDKDKK